MRAFTSSATCDLVQPCRISTTLTNQDTQLRAFPYDFGAAAGIKASYKTISAMTKSSLVPTILGAGVERCVSASVCCPFVTFIVCDLVVFYSSVQRTLQPCQGGRA